MSQCRGRRLLALLCLLGLAWSGSAAGANARMYEVNSKLQQRKILLGGKAEQPGCHDMLWGKQVYRFAQFGFAWCSLYHEKSCAPESIVPAYWSEGKYRRYNIDGTQPQEKLYPGGKWILKSDGIEVKSPALFKGSSTKTSLKEWTATLWIRRICPMWKRSFARRSSSLLFYPVYCLG